MKWLQQRKIVITAGDGYYAPSTLLMEGGTERRRCHVTVVYLPKIIGGGKDRSFNERGGN